MTKRIVDMQFIKISKDIENAWFVKNTYYFRLAMYLLIHANWADNCKTKRGELYFSFRSVANATGISKSTVEKFIKEARERGDVTLRKDGKGSILTLHFYDSGVPPDGTDRPVERDESSCHTGRIVPPDGTTHIIEKNNKKSDSCESHSQLSFFENPPTKKTPRRVPSKKKKVRSSTHGIKTPRQPNPVFQLREFWEDRWKWHCRMTWGEFTFVERDWGMLKNLHSKYGMEKAKYYIEEYLRKDDPSLASKGYPLGILLIQAERIRQQDEEKKRRKQEYWDSMLKVNTGNIPNSVRFAGATPAT